MAARKRFTKGRLIIEVETSLNGLRISRVLDWLLLTRGKPEGITVDSGPEFASREMDR